MAKSANDLPTHEQVAIAHRYSHTFLICGEEHPDEGYGFEVCEAQELSRQNAALTEAYRKAVARLSQEPQASLARSQRQWSVDSSKTCHATAADKAADQSYVGCMIDETIRRTIWLEKLR